MQEATATAATTATATTTTAATATATTTTTIFPLDTDNAASQEPEFPAERLEGTTPYQRVMLLARSGSRHSALRELQRILTEAGDTRTRAFCYFEAGRIRETMQEWEAARACYEEAASRMPAADKASYLAFNNLAYCQNRLRRHAEAERSCRRAIEIDSKPFNAHKNLGIALEGLGRIAEAAESYHRAFRAAPNEQVALRRLRFLLARHPESAAELPELVRDIEHHLNKGRRGWTKTQAVRAREDQDTLRRLLGSIQIDEPLVNRDLQVFGLRWQPAPIDYRTLDDAMSKKGVEIMEISESGSVPTIRVVNHMKCRVFVMAGEGLVGAKQNRVMNASIVLEAGADLNLPVSCVERGRWSYRTRRFESHLMSSHYTLRHMMSRHSYDSYRSRGEPGSDQGEVWQEVDRVLESQGTKSPSSALHDAYEQAGELLREATERLRPGTHWCGAVFALGDTVVGLDLFDKPSTLQKLWPMLVGAYALDVLRRPAPPPASPKVAKEQVAEWIQGSRGAVMDAFPSPGLGIDVRLESDRHVGAALMVDGTPVHLEMFYENDV